MVSNQNRTPLFDALKAYQERNVIPFDVPGHKHGAGLKEFGEFVGNKVLQIDVNSMKPLDNLNNPVSVIKEAEDLAAEAYWADHSFFLVNGTTSGVQAMIMPRNAHKSAINGLILSGAIPVYIQPEINERLGIAMGVTIENVEKAIARNFDAKAIYLINPTYYGATSDIKSIVKIAHKYGMAVIVDEAHGAHFRFNDELPYDAIELGADMCAVSMHKTGGSLTQSSLLLIKEGLVDEKTAQTVLSLTQTTSASYLLMVSLDIARKTLAIHGQALLSETLRLARFAREEINKIDGLYAFGKELVGSPGVFDFDETKLGINVADLGLTGFEVYNLLRDEYNIQVEMGDAFNILALISFGDSDNTVKALIEALRDISKRFNGTKSKVSFDRVAILENPELIVSPRHAFYSRKKAVKLEESEGEISGESIMVYPPGIPIVIPGERISIDMIDYIKMLKKQNSSLQGTEDPEVEYVKVLGSL